MKYLNKSFQVPAGSSKVSQDDWEAIFGTEEERKQKMAEAIEERKRTRRPAPSRCGGGTGAGKTQSAMGPGHEFNLMDGFQAAQTEAIDQCCEAHAAELGVGVDAMKSKVKAVTTDILSEKADMARRGYDPHDPGVTHSRRETLRRSR